MQSPVAMVASSAISIAAVACQGLVDVRRAEGLSGPASLFLLGIADSGERKTSGDGHFKTPLTEYEREIFDTISPDVDRFKADLAIWETKKAALLEKIKADTKTSKDTWVIESDLRDLEVHKPVKPRVPRVVRTDDTPENLAYSLMHEWPSAGVMSSEAGLVFGGHAMGENSIMRHLALLNLLWDGGEHNIGRRTSESFKLHGVRLSVALQVQEATLRDFFGRSGNLARGIGFFARFLVYWPESTQGTRWFKEAPPSWPALSAFHRRVRTVLDHPLPMQDDGSLVPAIMDLSPEAKDAWIRFHDLVEAELGGGGELADIRDVAAKAAENAARLASLFQVLEQGTGGLVSLTNFNAASRIVAWHLGEARRFFGAIALPVELSNAAKLDTWLIQRCRQLHTDAVSTRDVQQYGPGCLRSAAGIEEAVVVLAELDRARMVQHGRKKTIKVNPALLSEAHHGNA